MRIDHIGIAVHSVEEAKSFYTTVLGLPISPVEELPSMGVRVAFVEFGGVRVELIEPLGEDSPVSRFLEKRGQGVHHICFQVRDIASIMTRLREQACRLIDQEPRRGADGCLVAFVHPESAAGVLVEFRESVADPVSKKSRKTGKEA